MEKGFLTLDLNSFKNIFKSTSDFVFRKQLILNYVAYRKPVYFASFNTGSKIRLAWKNVKLLGIWSH